MSETCANPTGGIIGPRDLTLFLNIGGELIKEAVQQLCYYYKVNANETKVNLYGEALDKTYYRPVEIYARIEYGDITSTYEGFGQDATQIVTFTFLKKELVDSGVLLEVGDYLRFDDGYYEISNVSENQLVGGQFANSLSIVASTFLTRKSSLNITERVK